MAPGILYFVARNLAVGFALRGSYADYAATAFPYTEGELGGSVGLGVNLPLSARLSFFPRLWLGAGYMRRQYDEVPLPPRQFNDPSFLSPEPTTTLEGGFATGELWLPLQLQLGSAAFLAFGPSARLRLPFEDGTGIFRVGLTDERGRLLLNAHHRHCALVLWALSAVGMSGGAARADDREPLGSPGQWLLDGGAGGSYQLTHTAAPANARLQFTDVVHWSGWLAPSAQLFVARDVALGGSIGIGSDYTTRYDFDLSEVSISASPQVSFHAALGDHAFLLPELTLGIAYVQRTLTFSTGLGPFEKGIASFPIERSTLRSAPIWVCCRQRCSCRSHSRRRRASSWALAPT